MPIHLSLQLGPVNGGQPSFWGGEFLLFDQASSNVLGVDDGNLGC